MSQYMLTVRRQKSGFELTMRDGAEHTALRNGGKTPREGAIWLLRHAHRLLEETEAAILDVGLLTDAEVEAISLGEDTTLALMPPKP